MAKLKDLTGMKFGRLMVIEQDFSRNSKRTYWKCLCDCGNITSVRADSLSARKVISCGCYNFEKSNAKAVELSRIANKKYNRYDLSGTYGIGYDKNNKEFYFDLEDYEKIKNYRWYVHNNGYAVCSINLGYNKYSDLKMHRLILNECPNLEIDHKDRNHREDNRKSNLRYADKNQNSANRGRKDNKTGIIGVQKVITKNKLIRWKAHITWKGIRHHLGTYCEFLEAVVIRLKAEQQYFGEFAPQRHLFKQYGIEG